MEARNLARVMANPKPLYTKPLKLRIVAVSPKRTFSAKAGRDISMWSVGAADGSGPAKLLVYDESKLDLLKEGKSVMLLNLGVIKSSHITVQSNSVVGKTTEVNCTDAACSRAGHRFSTPSSDSTIGL